MAKKTVLSILDETDWVLISILDVSDSVALATALTTVRTEQMLADDYTFNPDTDTAEIREAVIEKLDQESWFSDMFAVDRNRQALFGNIPSQYLFQQRVEKKMFDGIAVGHDTVVLLNVPDNIKNIIKAELSGQGVTFEEPSTVTPEGVLSGYVSTATMGILKREIEWQDLWEGYLRHHEASNEIWPKGDSVTEEGGW